VNTLIGIFELATGRAQGFGRFGASPRDFVVSFAVLIAVPALGSLLLATQYGMVMGLTILLAVVCALLGPPVLSHLFARAWGQEALWLRFAIVFNWSRLAITTLYAILLAVAAILMRAGFPNEAVAVLLQLGMLGYTLWFDWFLIRHGLQISARRAALAVLGVNAGTLVIVFGPPLLAALLFGSAATPG
jgi:hypothetical protein